MIRGIYTAIVTPFDKTSEKIDFDALNKILDFQIKSKVSGVIVAGSTGEGGSLSIEEYEKLCSASSSYVDKKIKVVAGCPSNDTKKCVEMAKIAEKNNIDSLMCVIPFYNKPSQEGIFRHFKAIHDSVNIPIILYSVKGRTVVDFSDETILKLADLERVVAMKDSSNDIERPLRIRDKNQKLNLLCGDDSLFLAYSAQGGYGLVSVASNIIPEEMVKIQNSIDANDYLGALHNHQKYINLYSALFIESNPVPVKYALSLMGICGSNVRLPLFDLSEESKRKLQRAMEDSNH